MIPFGVVRPGSTLRIPWDSFAAATGAPSAVTNYAIGDVSIYKDGNTTQRVAVSPDTVTTSFDGVTGINEATLDLSDNSTAGFYAAGSNYVVVVTPVTIDGQTMSFVAATFTIGYPAAILNTTIATLASQTSFTLTAGPAEDDALNGMWVMIHDVASAVQCGWAIVLDYTGSTKTVTLAAATTYTAAATDNFAVMDRAPLQPATIGRTVVVDANGLADANTVRVGPTGSGTAQTAGDIMADTNDIQARLPAALTGDGNIKADTLRVGGTLQTAGDIIGDTNDIQARLPAALTANGNMKSSLLEIITTALTEGAAGRIAAAWQGMWNVVSPVFTAQSVNQTGDGFARLGAPAGASVSADIAAIRVDTNTTIPALIAALNNLSAAQVNAEVVDALNVDTYAQPGQGTPAATTTIRLMLAYTYKFLRNRVTQTATQLSVYNDDAATIDQKASFSDDGVTADRGEVATGP